GIRAFHVTGVQTCALPISPHEGEPLLRLDAPRLRDELEAVAGVGEATVRRVLPHGLEITVVPRVPVATVAAEDGYVLLDAEGVRSEERRVGKGGRARRRPR